MEGPTDVEAQSTLSTSFLEGFASAVDSVDITRDDELTRAVEVGSDDYPTLNGFEDLDDLLIGQTEDSRHRTRVSFASLLHSQSTLGDETHGIKKNLIAQLTAPVRWTESVQAMVADGATRFVEVGPGAVLQGLVKKIAPAVETEGKQ